ncbi:MAG: response regulator [Acidobacteriia bacterium]|nr:response regulator [Terriglobia bacterium]
MPNILVIDQDLHLRRMVRQVLERVGFAVAEAVTLKEVTEQIAQRVPDVIILDCLLGGSGLGLDLLRDIRATPRTHDIPVILTTGIPEPEIDIRLGNCGATAYLLKPFGPRDLVQAVAIAGGIQPPAPGSKPGISCGTLLRPAKSP